MKKYIATFLLCLLVSSNCNAATVEDDGVASPLASYVFSEADSSISAYAYGGSCGLVGYGSGTLTITLQFQSTYDKSWRTYDSETDSISFSNTTICNHSHGRLLTAPNKYRCKTYAQATVGSHWDDKTVYSPVLTIY